MSEPERDDGLSATAAYWQEQAHVYAAELQRIYKNERSGRAALASAQAQLMRYADDLHVAFQAERSRRQEIQRAYLETIRMLAAAVEARDPYTGGHLERVTRYALAIARSLGWDHERLGEAEMGAILHDIGKIGIQDAVLRKPGPLSPDEWVHMKTHPVVGAQILHGISFLEPVIPYVRNHHERFDGKGYPDGQSGDNIPIGGRLVAVADAFDAMTSNRPYRNALSVDVALAEIESSAGTGFDPAVVEAFMRAYRAGEILPSGER
ncbi:MAG TPA: HD-GYP domain-containing protein [Chloroflexota bacterium]|nr:HD-GYP domain-containing protein [Chloroflexota bacterium]